MKTNHFKTAAAALLAGTMMLSGAAYASEGEHSPAGNNPQAAAKPAKSNTMTDNTTAATPTKPAQGLILTDPFQAAELYIFGLQKRNAHIQYATFSKSMQKRMKPKFHELNWVTGVSSPWITKWTMTKHTKVNTSREIIELRLDTATSMGPEAPIILRITVVKAGNSWFVDAVSVKGDLPHSGLPESTENKVTALGVQEAEQLAAKAAAHYWHISSGGNATSDGEIKEFSIKGKGDHYRWMGKDLSTKGKWTAYLLEVFTPEKVRQYWDAQVKSVSLVEVNGRLAQPNADGGSLTDWSKAKAKLLENGDTVKKFRFKVPDGDHDSQTYDVTFRYLAASGWRIDEEVTKIK
ncbi:IseA DL-endopeptidase inhibitor family protein [Paenibacillus sp. N3/727]|uniref:IseA DL-endopeptidase inhibitor family protein n=1 Tax=Paenibacillus sp. N3/727 TaxID=2925845 RepID=UPI001F53BA96|nr:IseA DL-endopeptidase inhibitor family protein [Paenibacillus sp. N3/727]UNK17485.1 IseA DL-endopeptidase inhibitor family protein [Paenibacillus sp. N3/727]